MKKIAVVTASIVVTLILTACGDPNTTNQLANIEQRLDQLENKNRYLEDYIAIWRVQS